MTLQPEIYSADANKYLPYYQNGKIPISKSKKLITQIPKTVKTNMIKIVIPWNWARIMTALIKYPRTRSRTNAIHLKSIQSPGGGQRPIAWIVKGKPTGYQFVMIDSMIVGQTIQPKTKSKTTAKISF